MKIKRKSLDVKEVFTPGVRFTTREGEQYEVIETFQGIIGNCARTGAILEPNDYNAFLCHKKYRCNDIVKIDICITLEEEACPIDELKGKSILDAIYMYAEYLNLNCEVSAENLYRHAKLARVWFDVKTGEPLCEEGYDIAKMNDDDLSFVREIERMKAE